MRFDRDDELDRALFELPLEEPPRALRAAILASTVYRPRATVSLGETVVVGTLAALIVWLLTELVLGGGQLFGRAFIEIGASAFAALSNVSVLAWLGTGSAIAAWLVFFTEFQPAYVGGRRGKDPSKR